MTGPAPKDPALRQRRNKPSTSAKLSEGTKPRRNAMPTKLPERRVRVEHLEVDALGELTGEITWVETVLEWHPQTIAEWKRIRNSAMAPQFTEVDVDGLFMLAELYDQFHWTRDPKLMGEIRLQRQCFGLTPIDRRRLGWEIEEPAAPRAGASRSGRNSDAPNTEAIGNEDAPAAQPEDPRSLFRIVG